MIPYIGFGNDQLKNQPEVKEGMEIICKVCGLLHKIEFATDSKTGKKDNILGFYKCPQTKDMYLASVSGKLCMGVKPCAGGEL